MTQPVLDLVQERLDAQLKRANNLELVPAVGVWLGVLERAQSTGSESGLLRYSDVAELGIAVAMSGEVEVVHRFTEGLSWLMKRKFFVPNQAPGLEGDPLALLALSIGLHSLPENTEVKAWLKDLLTRASENENDDQRRSLIMAGLAVVEGENGHWTPVSPVVQTALAGKGLAPKEAVACREALKQIISSEPTTDEMAVFHAAALKIVFGFEASIDLEVPTIGHVCALLRGVPAALKRWPWEEKPKTKHEDVSAQKWDIQHEYHVQSLLWALLRPVFPGLEDEENLPSLGHKHPRADLLIPALRLVVEVKYLRKATQTARAKIIEEVAADSGLYLTDTSDYSSLIAFVWDNSSSTHHHDEIVSGLRKVRGIIDVVIVSRPGEWSAGG